MIQTCMNAEKPLLFEVFGSDPPCSNKELASELKSLWAMEHPDFSMGGIDWAAEYVDPAMFDAAIAARDGPGRTQGDLRRRARAALAIHPVCPDAYVSFATAAEDYAEALEHCEKAIELAPQLMPNFDTLCENGEVWLHHPLRGFYRAWHCKANVLLRLGRFEEARDAFERLLELDGTPHFSWSSWANPRTDYIFLHMGLGDDERAHALASSADALWSEQYERASSSLVWFWDRALLDYRRNHRGWRGEPLSWVSPRGYSAYRDCFPRDEGTAIVYAVASIPLVYRYLSGELTLPSDLKPPTFKPGSKSHIAAALYARSRKRLWSETPGALEWAGLHYRTELAFRFPYRDDAEWTMPDDPDADWFRLAKLPSERSECLPLLFRALREGVHGRAMRYGRTLLFGAVCFGIGRDGRPLVPDVVEIVREMLKAGACVKRCSNASRSDPDSGLEPLAPVAYYNASEGGAKVARMLMDAGAEPSGKGRPSLNDPFKFALIQGNHFVVKAMLEHLAARPEWRASIGQMGSAERMLMLAQFYPFTSSCYHCANGGPTCERCIQDDPANQHHCGASWKKVLSHVVAAIPRDRPAIAQGFLDGLPAQRRRFPYASPLADYMEKKLRKHQRRAAAGGSQATLCAHCSAEYSTEVAKKNGGGKCGGCGTVYFCSKSCQAQNWASHKAECKAIQKTRNEGRDGEEKATKKRRGRRRKQQQLEEERSAAGGGAGRAQTTLAAPPTSREEYLAARAMLGNPSTVVNVRPIDYDEGGAANVHEDARCGELDQLREVLDAGTHPDYRSRQTTETPLMLASMYAKHECVALLLSRGACVWLTDYRGKDATGYLEQGPFYSVAKSDDGSGRHSELAADIARTSELLAFARSVTPRPAVLKPDFEPQCLLM